MFDIYDEFLNLVVSLDERGRLCLVRRDGVGGAWLASSNDRHRLVGAGRMSTTSENFKVDEQPTNIDMSGEAIATRLRRVSQLRRLCLSLGKARPEDDRYNASEYSPKSGKDDQTQVTDADQTN